MTTKMQLTPFELTVLLEIYTSPRYPESFQRIIDRCGSMTLIEETMDKFISLGIVNTTSSNKSNWKTDISELGHAYMLAILHTSLPSVMYVTENNRAIIDLITGEVSNVI